MKICYCVATTDLEGGAKSLLDLLKEMNHVKETKLYVILTKHYDILEKKLTELNVNYKIIYHGTDCKTKNKFKQLIKIFINEIAKFRLKKYFYNNQIDIVHNNSVLSLIAMEAALDLKIPYVCHVRENIESGLKLQMINYNKLYYLMNKSNCCIYISQAVKERYKKFVTSNNGAIIYDGLDTGNYILNDSEIKDSFKDLLLVGRISRGKCQLDAVKAIKILKEKFNEQYNLTIIGTIGDQDYYSEIKKFVEKNKLDNQIKLLSYSNSLKKLRKNNRIALVCSENEGLGRVTVEAMLSKQLVIGASAGATKELIRDGYNGYLYTLHDVDELASIINNINREQVQHVINNGYNFAIKNFDNNIEMKKVYDVYLKILGGKYEDEN